MADILTLTAQPIRVTTPSATIYQPIWAVRDVMAYDMLDLEVGVIGFEGSSPKITIQILTSMQCENDEEWAAFGSAQVITTANTFTTITNRPPLLRYLRWSVLSGGGNWGSQTAATFWIRGMVRTYEEASSGTGSG